MYLKVLHFYVEISFWKKIRVALGASLRVRPLEDH